MHQAISHGVRLEVEIILCSNLRGEAGRVQLVLDRDLDDAEEVARLDARVKLYVEVSLRPLRNDDLAVEITHTGHKILLLHSGKFLFVQLEPLGAHVSQ